MKCHSRIIACASLVAVAFLSACGGRQTMASKSAAAYAEAEKKGLKIGPGNEHGGHAVESTSTESASGHDMAGMDHSNMAGMDHSQMPKMDHSKMAGMDHSKVAAMDHSKMPEMDHSKMDHSKAPRMDHSKMAGMEHKNMPPMQHDMSAMQHGATADVQHGAMKHGSPAPPPDVRLGAPATNAEIAQTRPAATLRQDEFDAPSPVSAAEAAKSAPPPPRGKEER